MLNWVAAIRGGADMGGNLNTVKLYCMKIEKFINLFINL